MVALRGVLFLMREVALCCVCKADGDLVCLIGDHSNELRAALSNQRPATSHHTRPISHERNLEGYPVLVLGAISVSPASFSTNRGKTN